MIVRAYNYLFEQGIRRDQNIMIISSGRYEVLVLDLALQSLGAVTCFLDPGIEQESLRARIESEKPDVVIFES